MDVDYNQKFSEINDDYRILYEILGEKLGSYHSFRKVAFAKGEISRKTKAIIALVVTITQKDEQSVLYYLEKAIKTGANPNELKEIINMILVLTGDSYISCITTVLKSAEQFYYKKWLSEKQKEKI